MEVFFQNRSGKNLNFQNRNGNSAIGSPIVQTVVKDSWSFVPSTVQVMSRVLWLETSEKNGNP